MFEELSNIAVGFKTCIKTTLPLINHLINEGCRLLTMFQSVAASVHWWHPSLVSDKHVSACRFQSVSPCSLWRTGLVFMQPGVKVNGAHYCDVLLLQQLLPDICQASCWRCFPTYHACTRALYCCDTRLRTSHKTWPHNRPDFSSVDYRLLSHSGMRLSETARDVKHRWWAVVIDRKTFC